MKVILKQDVKTIGKKDEIHEVSDGTPATFYFPRPGCPGGRHSHEHGLHQKRSARGTTPPRLAAARELAAKVEGKTVALKAKGGASGRLFGKITAKDGPRR